MNEDTPYVVTNSRIAYQTPWVTVREDAITRKNSQEGTYSYIEAGDSVVIVAVNDQNEICLVESYRHPINRWVWELPGGGCDGEELAEVAAKRELKEETGFIALTWHTLGKARVYNGLSTEYQTNMLALSASLHEPIELEDEIRAYKFVSLNDLDTMIADGTLNDNQSITAIYMYKNWLAQQ